MKWWGHPIYLGATELLPKDHDEHPEVHFPFNYERTISRCAPARLRHRRSLRRVLACRFDAADDFCDAAAPLTLLRRFVPRELAERRPKP